MTVPVIQWHNTAWRQLQTAHRQQRLPHALLITGEPGIGKGEFASQLAASLLCEQPDDDGQPCGQCHACQRLAARTHPDRFWLLPDEPGKPIKVDAVRQLITDLALTRHYGGYRVVSVEPADAMNTSAANAFLKTLEEPPPNTVLLLVSATPTRLPATIRSRCQLLRLHSPVEADATAWLAQAIPEAGEQAPLALRLAGGAPLLAARYLQEGWLEGRRRLVEALLACARGEAGPLQAAAVAEELFKQDRQLPITWMYHWVADLVRLAYDDKNIKNNDMADELQKLPEPVEPAALHRMLEKLQQSRRLSDTTVNPRLLWEDMMIDWSGLFASGQS